MCVRVDPSWLCPVAEEVLLLPVCTPRWGGHCGEVTHTVCGRRATGVNRTKREVDFA